MYTRLAAALVAAAPVPVAGGLVLDLGSGDGAAGRAALAAGAGHVVAADLSLGMLGRVAPALCPVAADAVALPFRDRRFDLVLAAFCLNHLDGLAAALAEARRVGGAIAASVFAPGWTHPAKDAVDTVLRASGYQPPGWYTALAPGSRASDPGALAAAAIEAGFTGVQVRTKDVRVELSAPAGLAAWRLGMAHVAPYLHSLDPAARSAVRAAAEHAVASLPAGGPLTVSMVVLTAS
jgi:SAM-dependent methyltransferase